MGRHHQQRRLSFTTWIAALAGLAVVGAIALAMAPANAAAATKNVQLTLSGVAYDDQPTGGSVVGVHPGDSVHMTASGIPTAGAPAGLGDILGRLLSGVAGLQVKITSGNLPGVPKNYLLGKVSGCGGHDMLALNSLAKGTYNFTYVIQSVSLLPLLGTCKTLAITPTQDQIGKLTKDNVKFTDNAQYSGQVVVAAAPPPGKIGVQLPSHSISVKAGPISTSITLPGATVGVTNPIPKITGALGSLAGGAKGSSGGKSSKPSNSVKYTPPALTVPEEVMPRAVNYGGAGGSGGSFAAPGGDTGNGAGGYVAPAPQVTRTATPVPTSTAQPKNAAKTVDVAATKSQLGGAQLPVLLAIVAILALSLVTAMYARMYLLRRN